MAAGHDPFVDLKGNAPRIVNTVDVGQYVEGLAFSSDGNYLAVIRRPARIWRQAIRSITITVYWSFSA